MRHVPTIANLPHVVCTLCVCSGVFSVWFVDALSAYLTNPSVPPNDDSDVTASVNLYLGGGSRPQWVQVIKLFSLIGCIVCTTVVH